MRFSFHFFIPALIKINIKKLGQQKNLIWGQFFANTKLFLNVHLLYFKCLFNIILIHHIHYFFSYHFESYILKEFLICKKI